MPALTDHQSTAFHDRGFLHLEGALETAETKSMLANVWLRLADQGVLEHDPGTWDPLKVRALQAIRDGDPNPMDNRRVADAIGELIGRPWRVKPNWGQALVTFPTQAPWKVSSGPWHLDHSAYQPPDCLTGVNVFLLLDDLAPGGGGTMLLEGSPVLIRQFSAEHPELAAEKAARWKRAFRESSTYVERLGDRRDDAPDRSAFFMDSEATVNGVGVRVAEITGRAGDVVICHPLLLHAPPRGQHEHSAPHDAHAAGLSLAARSRNPRADAVWSRRDQQTGISQWIFRTSCTRSRTLSPSSASIGRIS